MCRSLILSENVGVSGSLPSEIGNLPRLQYVAVQPILRLAGSCAQVCSALSLHRHVFLDGCQLSGTLPDTLSRLTALQILSIQGNAFTGTIPEAVVPILTNLAYVSHTWIIHCIPALPCCHILRLSSDHIFCCPFRAGWGTCVGTALLDWFPMRSCRLHPFS
jgi:hypothetical protein